MTTRKTRWQILARHKKWVAGAAITESYYLDDPNQNRRRFTATIRGFQNWKIWEGDLSTADNYLAFIIARVAEIRDRIDAGDQSVFEEP